MTVEEIKLRRMWGQHLLASPVLQELYPAILPQVYKVEKLSPVSTKE